MIHADSQWKFFDVSMRLWTTMHRREFITVRADSCHCAAIEETENEQSQDEHEYGLLTKQGKGGKVVETTYVLAYSIAMEFPFKTKKFWIEK
ncbi:hypothetical protein Y032_0037g3377 [Ancylostoma ceylanicum]|nr:hypothetical protein Y032_0037g3377 [Ancylostoma ceylanicum]